MREVTLRKRKEESPLTETFILSPACGRPSPADGTSHPSFIFPRKSLNTETRTCRNTTTQKNANTIVQKSVITEEFRTPAAQVPMIDPYRFALIKHLILPTPPSTAPTRCGSSSRRSRATTGSNPYPRCSTAYVRSSHRDPARIQAKNAFCVGNVRVTERRNNAAVESARFTLQSVAKNKLRHESVQEFMLVNEAAMVAVEVPIVLTEDDTHHYRTTLGYALRWTGTDRPSVLFERATTWLDMHKVLLPGCSTLEHYITRLRSRVEERLWLERGISRDQQTRLERLLDVPPGSRDECVSEKERGEVSGPRL
jgi:hypothetical protein